jgi:hypothetical protein
MSQRITTGLIAVMLALFLPAALAHAQGTTNRLTVEEEAFAAAVGVGAYAYGINEIMAYDMGTVVLPLPGHPRAEAWRLAGSEAEHEAADYLKAEMERIGLQNVAKEGFPVHAYEFRGASVQVLSPKRSEKMLASGHAGMDGTGRKGLTGEIVYVGLGRMQDYEALEAAGKSAVGKIVLVDLSENEMYWLQLPHMEARIQGAIGMVVHWVEYGEIEDSVVTMDSEAEFDLAIPAVSVSHKSFARLKELTETSSKPVKIEIVNDAEQRLDGVSYNIVGYIPGTTRPDELIIIADHYDKHWYGAEDDGSGIARLLGIAKALIDSGYQPARTLVFLATGAEEFGWTDTEYDWAIGAYNAIAKHHPDWAGRTLGYFNLEYGGSIGNTSVFARGTPEMNMFRHRMRPLFDAYFSTTDPYKAYYVPSVAWNVLSDTWTDEFSFGSHGIPTMRVDSYRQRPLLQDAYHTQMDTMDRVSAESLAMSIIANGIVAIRLDQAEVPPFDYSIWARRVSFFVEGSTLSWAGISTDAFYAALDRFSREGESTWERIDGGNPFEDPKAATDLLLQIHKLVGSTLITVGGWAEAFFPHQHYQNDVWVVGAVIDLLEAGDIDTALVYLRWAYDMWEGAWLSPEVYQSMFVERHDPTGDNLFWATDRLAHYTDLYDEYHSLVAKRDAGNTDYAPEIASLRVKYEDIRGHLQGAIDSMTSMFSTSADLLEEVQALN